VSFLIDLVSFVSKAKEYVQCLEPSVAEMGWINLVRLNFCVYSPCV
jgi:hypothetical protein